MKTIKNLLLCISLIMICFQHLVGNNLFITNTIYDPINNSLNFDVSWDSGFNIVNRPSDHVYLFVKYKNSNSSSWEPMYFPAVIHTADSPDVLIGNDNNSHNSPLFERFAIRISHAASFTSGSVDVNCTIFLSPNISLLNPSFKVFGIEMVKTSGVTNESYYMGDGISTFRFHKGSDPLTPYLYDGSSTPITTGNGPNDIAITGQILPVGTIPFTYARKQNNIMRYEITQQQYVDFLNCLSRIAQNTRTGTDISGTSVTKRYVMSSSSTLVDRNGIKCDATLPSGGPIIFYNDFNSNDVANEIGDGQNISANYLLPGDLLAYLDWAGLHPMNEMQYEYYCRGSILPVAGEFAWGSTHNTAATINGATDGGPDETPTNVGSNGLFRRSPSPIRTGSAATSTTNRIQAGASTLGVMDLTGNAAELVVGSYVAQDFDLISDGDGILDVL